jgi:hypothetical protein
VASVVGTGLTDAGCTEACGAEVGVTGVTSTGVTDAGCAEACGVVTGVSGRGMAEAGGAQAGCAEG